MVMADLPSVELGPALTDERRHFLSLPSGTREGRATPQSRNLETLSWDISYATVTRTEGSRRCQGKDKGQSCLRQILSGVVGEAGAGDLVAVMGASGCGKTTFVSCLALRNQSFEGNVYLNRQAVDETYLPLVGFVDQHDMFVPTLTVREHIIFHVMTRLNPSMSHEAKMLRAYNMLEEFNLLDVADSYIGGDGSLIRGISHGERKRLSFATELLSDPYIVIADEPTTGLDTLLAANVCQTLRNMADSGRIVISTIHQPSSKAFQSFTHVLLLALGRTAYYGPRETLISYFSSLKLSCPESHNPADFFVQSIAVPSENREEATRGVEGLIRHYEASALGQASQAWRSELPPSQRKREQVFSRKCSASFLTQFRYDLIRHSQADFRDTRMMVAKMGVAIVMGLLFGLAYREAPGPLDIHQVTDRLGLYFVLSSFITTTAILLVARSLPRDLHLFLRERMAGVNRTSTHYLATVLSALPCDLLWVTVCTVPLFLIAMPSITFLRLCTVTATLALLYLAAASVGYFISAATMNEAVALALMPPMAMPMVLFAGLLVNVPDVPWPMRWLEYTSLVKYAYHALVIQEFPQDLVITPPCHAGSPPSACRGVTGDDMIHRVNATRSEQHRDLLLLAAFTLAFHLLAYLSLWRRAKAASR